MCLKRVNLVNKKAITVGCLPPAFVVPSEGTWAQIYPAPSQKEHGPEIPYPWKGHGTRDQEGTWHERYPTPCGQINTCENITFPQIIWRAVISNSATDLVWTWLPPRNTGNKVSCRIKSWLGASLYFPRYNVRRQIRFIWQGNATISFSNSTWIRPMFRQGESRVDSH